ncbi:MAG: G-D-S-L family lipolytic protein [Flavobacteriaceae bacterium]|nr:MAG: G-D-S-L family lipolytic protein [Flavobacteriaceae bacterium]
MIFNKYKSLLILACAGVLMTSCNEDQWDLPVTEEIPLTSGTADLSTFVAIGNSLTAGYTDGALFMASQNNSFPNLLSQKFAMAGGGAFTQPWTNDNIGGLLLGGFKIQEPRLYFTGAGLARLDADPTNEISNVIQGPYNNMGVPGAKSFHLLANGYGNVGGVPLGLANPYYARMASSPNASMLEDARAMNASFFSLWIGSNDVLSYSIAGGSGVNQTGNFDPSTYGQADITDPNVFASVYNTLLDGLTSGGAQGVVMNIPNVSTIPYFTSVPYNPVPLDAATAAQLNGAFAGYNAGLLQVESFGLITAEERMDRTITFVEGDNAVTIVDDYLTDLSGFGLPSYRQATDSDLIVLLSSTFIGTTVGGNPQLINGVSVPLEDKWVLTSDEVTEVKMAVASYNQTIASLANTYGVAMIDANAIMQQLHDTGISFDEFNMSSDLIFGMTFSLDGIHLTARGNAFMANEVMRAIDQQYGSNFVQSGNLLKAADYTTFYPESLR